MESKRSLILHWAEQGALSKDKLTEVMLAEGVLPTGPRWREFIYRLLLWLGGLALAFAVMFFIAYNWDAMGRFAKFSLIELLIALCVFAYWKLGADKMTARVSLMIATILLGVLLAFYGQTYQTGADTWQLFANWALLMLPWALVSRISTLWLLWVALLNLSIVFYFQARGSLFWLVFGSTDHVFWVIFVFNALIWGAWELLAKRISWLAERWPVWIVAMAAGSAITALCLYAIFEDYALEPLAVLIYLGWIGVMYGVYRKLIPDLFMIAGLCLSVIAVLTGFFAWHLFRDGGDYFGAFLIMTLLVVGMAAGVAVWLKRLHREMQV